MKKLFQSALLFVLVVLLAVPAFANVLDETGVLSPDEAAFLDTYTDKITEEYGIGVYIMVVEDYNRYASGPYMEIFDVTANFYHANGLGIGEGRDGILLMVDLGNREAAFFVYGDEAQYALDDYGQLLLEEAFLDDFQNDDWYSGLMDFAETCEESFEAARAGEPVRESNGPMIGLVWLIAFVAAAVVCGVCYSSMKTARKQQTATAYVGAEGLNLTRRDDLFTHRTVTRVQKQQSSGSSGGRSHSGYGGSGRSSRF